MPEMRWRRRTSLPFNEPASVCQNFQEVATGELEPKLNS